MMPGTVRTILDVGCGDGALTVRLAEEWDVTGADMSAVALEHVKTAAVQASATDLPFADGSFDLVLSSEMLEHLSPGDYGRAISEMSRVTRRYLLLTVPYREDLRFRQVAARGAVGAGMCGAIGGSSPRRAWPTTSSAFSRSRRACSGRFRLRTGHGG